MIRVMDIVEVYLLPKIIARLAVKRYPSWSFGQFRPNRHLYPGVARYLMKGPNMNPDIVFTFTCPVKTNSGNKALENLPIELSVLNAGKPLIVTNIGQSGPDGHPDTDGRIWRFGHDTGGFRRSRWQGRSRPHRTVENNLHQREIRLHYCSGRRNN